MRLNSKERAAGLIDADYCLQISHDMLDVFNQEEVENHGFNSLEMLMIKAVFDDLFENMIKSRYKKGRNQVIDALIEDENNLHSTKSNDNIIDFLNFLD